MGFFSDLGKSLGSLSLSNQLVSAATGKKAKGSASQTLLFGKKEKPAQPAPFQPQNRIGATINGRSGPQDLPALRLGWTNGGYTYNNSPFNQQPMSFGGGATPPPAPVGGGSSPPPSTGVAPPQRLPMPMGGPANPNMVSGSKMDPRMTQQLMMAQALRKPMPVM